MSAWSETMIAKSLALHTFERRHLVMLPNCNWTGHECDLLVVTKDLRIIDVEVKISRADLRVDAKKSKWWEQMAWRNDSSGQRRLWPPKVWKHYYALPNELWRDDLYDAMSPASGVLLLTQGADGHVFVTCARRAKPDIGAYRVTPEAAIDIARLANLRYWDQVRANREAA